MKKVLILFLAAFALWACGNEATTSDNEGEGQEMHADHEGHDHDGHSHEGEATTEGDGKTFWGGDH